MSNKKHTLLIVGGGAAGISVAANIRRKNKDLDIGIIEPSDVHYYQPGFTIIGGGEYSLKKATRSEADLLPNNVHWIREYTESFQPDQNTVTLRSGDKVAYEYLVVCPGLQLDFDKIEGLPETLGKNGVSSNYSPHTVEYTWECIRNLESGTALFTQPPMPIKCAGAPQKIMYLAADRFRKKGIADKINVEFFNAGPAMFGVPFFSNALDKVVSGYGIKTNFGHNLVAIDGNNKTATFEYSGADDKKQRVTESFDFIHVTPPQSAPDFIKKSPLAADSGWVSVDQNTLQHTQFENVFSLGDVTTTPNAKTAAAVRKQVPVVVKNLFALMNGQELTPGYQGYGSCPLTTAIGKVMLAEFSYGGKVTPSFPFLDPRNNSFIWWIGKKIGFPWLYWDLMLKGYDFDIPSKESYVKRLLQE